MTTPDAALTARMDTALRAEREAVLEDLGPDAVLWLALVPLWTKSAAETVGFPARPLIDFIQRARKIGWCETRGSLRAGGSPTLRFWMPDHLRRDVLDMLRRYTGAAAAEIANRVLREADPHRGASNTFAASRPGAIPGALEAWAGLMRFPDRADRRLVDSVKSAVDQGDLGRAQDLISAGEALAALLAGTMDVAVDRARRLLNLGRRRRMDAADLDRYLDRPELSNAVDRLLAPETGQWALHLRGVGGVGKTMLVKYLAAGRYAGDREEAPIPVARVDFDYMSPDFPVRRPVQLLLELADELSLHMASIGAADYALRKFRDSAVTAHEAFSGGVGSEAGIGVGGVLEDDRVWRAVNDFADALRRLPRVLLILDTCEELAKFDAGDPAKPAVTTTFGMLERIHERAPRVRVLFAGRRDLPAHDYLAVQPVSGFTADEARRYLSSFPGPPVAGDLAAEMIRQSPAVDDPERISPFDLALYRSWAEEDPDLSAATVARGSDAYIEGRIIERLSDDEGDVLRALPALSTAGRCRAETLAAFLNVTPDDLGRRLAAQEWIDATGDPPVYLAAKPALATRLRRYFRSPDRAAAFGRETTRLAELLRSRIADAPVADIDIDEVLAALRLSGPAAAAALWDDLADRAKNARHWDWLRLAADRIRGEWEEEEWPTTRALRATVIAAHIAATRRSNPTFNAQPSWADVLESWPDHPSRARGLVLEARASAMLGMREWTNEPKDDPEVAAAVVDVAHRLLEDGRDDEAARILPPPSDASIESWVCVGIARLNADADPRLTPGLLRDAESMARRAQERASEYFDWIQPDDLLARVRIEYGLIAPPDDEKLEEWESYAEQNFDTIDAERLASQCLRIRLTRGVIEKARIERWEGIDRYVLAWQSSCSAHELVPPLFVTLAEAWLAAGEPNRALVLLDRRRRAALETRQDESTIRAAEMARVRIARRLRLNNELPVVERWADRGDGESLEALAVLSGHASDHLRERLLRFSLTVPRRVRTADPYADVRVALRYAALEETPYRASPDVPRRLLAEIAFNEGELLGLVRPDAADRAFAVARGAYEECGDRIGAVFAVVAPALYGNRPAVSVTSVEEALDRLRTENPSVWNILVSDPERVGRWAYWSGAVRRCLPEVADSSPPTAAPPYGRPSLTFPAESMPASTPGAWETAGAPRSWGPDQPAVVVEGGNDKGTIELTMGQSAYRGSWETARDGSVVARWSAETARSLGTLELLPNGTPGSIATEPSLATVTWERVLSESLRFAAERVAWCRRLSISVRVSQGAEVALVSGRGVRSSAGPQIVGSVEHYSDTEVGFTPTRHSLGRTELTDPADLGTRSHALIVLRGDPVVDEAEATAGDDLAEKLEFALNLLQRGAAPTVLIVPSLPAYSGRAITRAVAGYVAEYIREGRDDPLQLQKSVREHVPSALLNDVVPLVNEGAIRE